MKFYLAFNYSQENSFPIYVFFNKLINSCNVELRQRHLADIYEKLVHSMPITMQCGGKPKNSPTLTANNSGLKPSKLKNYHIFRKPWTSAFRWYTLDTSEKCSNLRKKRLRLRSFGPFWTISTENQWEITEIECLSCFGEFFVRFHIVFDRYTPDYDQITFCDTI